MSMDHAETLVRVASAADTDPEAARRLLQAEYPFVPFQNAGRSYSLTKATAVFMRDGFIDRYSGACLVFPGALRLLSVLFPGEFPYHKNGRADLGHFAFWELFPSIDHVQPVSRGGADDESNWVTTSMLRNAAKSNWTLDELGWQLRPPGDMREWDGLMRWYVERCTRQPELAVDARMKGWLRAAKARA